MDELSGSDATDHLLDAAAGGELPPEDVSRGAAVALWFSILLSGCATIENLRADITGRPVASEAEATADAALPQADDSAGVRAIYGVRAR